MGITLKESHKKYVQDFMYPIFYQKRYIQKILYILPVIAFIVFVQVLIIPPLIFKENCQDMNMYTQKYEPGVEVYHTCAYEKLCDISHYGACPGISFNIFSICISISGVLVYLLFEFRINIWAQIIYQIQELKIEDIKLNQPLLQDEIVDRDSQNDQLIFYNYNQKQLQKLEKLVFYDKLFIYITIVFLYPMAWIPYYKSSFHFISAIVTFGSFGLVILIDTYINKKVVVILINLYKQNFGQQQNDQNIYEKLQKKQYVAYYNWFLFGSNSILVSIWNFADLSICEFIGALTPFLYFTPFLWETPLYYKISQQLNKFSIQQQQQKDFDDKL